MAAFNRGLKGELVEALNKEFRKDGWWKKIVEDENLFLGIRNDYVNVYYQGNSLLKLRLDKGVLASETHYKYLLKPDIKPEYFSSSRGIVSLPKNLKEFFILDLGSEKALDRLKRASRPYAGEEKEGCHDIVKANTNVIDVEIAFKKESSESEKRTSPRVDFVALQENENGLELIFFEAKHFTNPELRAKETPKVVKQIENYESLIEEHEHDIKKSYHRVCCNLTELEGIRTQTENFARKALSGFTVSKKPRLVIYGFDADQRNGTVWKCHLDNLKELLEKDRVLLKGESKGFTRGIS